MAKMIHILKKVENLKNWYCCLYGDGHQYLIRLTKNGTISHVDKTKYLGIYFYELRSSDDTYKLPEKSFGKFEDWGKMSYIDTEKICSDKYYIRFDRQDKVFFEKIP